MGYRSVAAFCLSVKEPEKFVALLKTKDDKVTNEMLQYMYLDVEGLIHFYVDHWKWYEESETAFSGIMNMAQEYDGDMSCRFARYGEEMDDVHEEAFGDLGWDLDYPYIVRSMEIGYDPNTAKKVLEI